MIAGDVVDLMGDPSLAVTITYKAFQSRTFTPETGASTVTYADTTLGAIRNEIPSKEVQAAAGLYQQGDLRFIIARAQLIPAPGREDLILDAGIVYNLVAWDSDPVSALWRIVARKVRAA